MLCAQGGNGSCSELQVGIDPSKLLDVASAIKHGHVLPWSSLRTYWAENPITNVGLFGLLVTSWAGFLSVRQHRHSTEIQRQKRCDAADDSCSVTSILSVRSLLVGI
jgi:hypothetical protein